ncbi:MAG: hypothetical protein ACTSRF_11295 [Candidatus Freyarchaeota archaeon]
MGTPARLVRELRDNELEVSRLATQIYKGLVKKYSEKKIVGYRKSEK